MGEKMIFKFLFTVTLTFEL